MNALTVAVFCPRCGGNLEPVVVGAPMIGEASTVAYCPTCRVEVHYRLIVQQLPGRHQAPELVGLEATMRVRVVAMHTPQQIAHVAEDVPKRLREVADQLELEVGLGHAEHAMVVLGLIADNCNEVAAHIAQHLAEWQASQS